VEAETAPAAEGPDGRRAGDTLQGDTCRVVQEDLAEVAQGQEESLDLVQERIPEEGEVRQTQAHEAALEEDTPVDREEVHPYHLPA